jgi:AcrR family transcriptional regulator
MSAPKPSSTDAPANGARPAPARRRRNPRTQEERSAATRAKVIQAATECVADLGFRGATMGAIADRAGVSWGAIQHQFGEKDALLDAVLEEAVRVLQAGLSQIREEESDPVERVQRFVRRSGSLLQGPVYRAFFEIQVARSRAVDEQSEAWSKYVVDALDESWNVLFGDLTLSQRRLEDAQRFTFAVLSGIAAESMLFPGEVTADRQLDILAQTLLRLLDLER